MNKTMKNEYAIINKTDIEQKLASLEAKYSSLDDFTKNSSIGSTIKRDIDLLKLILSNTSPLNPEIEKAFNAGERYNLFPLSCESKEDYIKNLKLPI